MAEEEAAPRVDSGGATAGEEFFIGEEVPRGDEHRAPPQTRTDERDLIRKFALRMIFFGAPLLFLFLVIESLLWRAGETWPIERVIHAQEANPNSFFARDAIDDGTFRYKYLQILRRHPEIVALGSSRVMQFRSEMFGRQAPSFYNAGGMIHSVQDLNDFIERLPQDATPKIAILGIDFWWLNTNIEKQATDSFAIGSLLDGAYRWQDHAYVLSQYVQHPLSLRSLVKYSVATKRYSEAIGLRARRRHRGYRLDGSLLFTVTIPKTPEAWTQRITGLETAARIDIWSGKFHSGFADDRRIFAPADHGVSPSLAEQLRSALLKLKARGIFVIGYSPPVFTKCARIASTAPLQREYWKQYHEIVPSLFRSLGIPFLDIETPDQLGLDDRYMRDPYHPYDTFDMYLLNRFCENPEVRSALPDVPTVAEKALGSRRTNPLYLDFGDSEEPHHGN